jgi:hypothetical protein
MILERDTGFEPSQRDFGVFNRYAPSHANLARRKRVRVSILSTPVPTRLRRAT